MEVIYWASALEALAPRLDPVAAADDASRVVNVMRTTLFPVSLPYLERTATARRCGWGLRMRRSSPARPSRRWIRRPTLSALCHAVGLGPTTNPIGQTAIAEVLAEMTPRLAPAEARRLASAAARQLMDTMKNTTDPLARIALRVPWRRRSRGWSRRRPAGWRRPPQNRSWRRRGTLPIPKLCTTWPWRSRCCAQPEAGESAQRTSAVAREVENALAKATSGRPVVDALGNTIPPYVLFPHLAGGGLAALAPRLETAEASAAARQTVDVMARVNDSDNLYELASCRSRP